MKETEKTETCCEKINTGPSCSCSSDECDCGKPARQKIPKLIICLLILLAVISIVAYKTLNANNSNGIISDGVVAFAFGQPASETPSSTGNTIQAERNFGEYVKSLEELNVVAIDNDVVFVFVPASSNVLIDDTTKATILKVQQDLQRGDAKIGRYTLWYDSPDYAEITKQVKMPAIIVARNGKGTVIISGSNTTEYMLFQAYIDAVTGECCEPSPTECCN